MVKLNQNENWIESLIDRQIIEIKVVKEGIYLYAIFTTADGNKSILKADKVSGFKTVKAKDIFVFELGLTGLMEKVYKLEKLYNEIAVEMEEYFNFIQDFELCRCAQKAIKLLESKGQKVPDFFKQFMGQDCRLLLPKVNINLPKVKCQIDMGSLSFDLNIDTEFKIKLPCGLKALEQDWKDLLTGQKIEDIKVIKEKNVTVIFFKCQGGILIPITWDYKGFKLFSADSLFHVEIKDDWTTEIISLYPAINKLIECLKGGDCLNKIKKALELSLCQLPGLDLNFSADFNFNIDLDFDFTPPKLLCRFKGSNLDDVAEGYGYDAEGNYKKPIVIELDQDKGADKEFCRRFPNIDAQIKAQTEAQKISSIKKAEGSCERFSQSDNTDKNNLNNGGQ